VKQVQIARTAGGAGTGLSARWSDDSRKLSPRKACLFVCASVLGASKCLAMGTQLQVEHSSRWVSSFFSTFDSKMVRMGP
jgi:hypothetical protein